MQTACAPIYLTDIIDIVIYLTHNGRIQLAYIFNVYEMKHISLHYISMHCDPTLNLD